MMKYNGYVLTSGTHSLDREYDEGTDQFIGRHVARQVNSTKSLRNAGNGSFWLHMKPD